MGLRQLYFLIEGLLERIVYLSKGLAITTVLSLSSRFRRAESRSARPVTPKSLEVAGERCPVRVTLLEERVAALDGIVGHVGQSRCLTGE